MKHTTPILRVFSVMAAAALFCCACQEEAPEINYTVIVTNDFSKVVDAINDGTIKQTEAVARLIEAIDRLNADQAGKLQAVIAILTSTSHTLEVKLAAIEAALKAQTLAIESKLQLIETAIQTLPDYGSKLEAIRTAIAALPDYGDKLAAIETAIQTLPDYSEQFSALNELIESTAVSVTGKLAAVEAVIKAQTIGIESKLQLIKAAIEALPDYSDELTAIKTIIDESSEAVAGKLEALKTVMESQTLSVEAKLQMIKEAIKALSDYDQKFDALVAALDAITARIAAEGNKLPELKAAIDSITASLHDLVAEVECGHTDLASALAQIIAELDALLTQSPDPEVLVETAFGMELELVHVAGGTFDMGATSEQGSDAWGDERPIHRVTLSGYYIGKYEVTQGQWQAVMGNNPSHFKKGDNYPVECVSWDDIQEFIQKLNEKTRRQYVLPTEAQWEYAARGGNKSEGYKYSGSANIDEVAWYWDNIPSQTYGAIGYGTQPVGTKSPNELGICDMCGNVYEWCGDWYGDYGADAQMDPQGPDTGVNRVLRGGGWYYDARRCRLSYRSADPPGERYDNYGFRLALLP